MKFSLIALAAAGVACAATVPYATDPKAVDIEILQYALTLEHLEAKFYADGLAKFGPDDFQKIGAGPEVRQRLQEIANHEATHVNVLSSVLEGNGATPTEPCVYDFPYTDLKSFLSLSALLENVGVSAYLYKAQFINTKAYLEAAGAILSVEARHQALVSAFQGLDGIPTPFDTPLTGSEVLSLATPLIVSCPATNPAFPFKVFKPLSVSPASTVSGATIDIGFPQGPFGLTQAYVHFLSGLSDDVVPLVDGKATVPAHLYGTVYVIVSQTSDRPNDDTTIAGPFPLAVGNLLDATTYDAPAPSKRAVKFVA